MAERPDIRAQFERYFAESRKSKGAGKRPTFARLPDDTYADDHTQRHWWTWQQAVAQLRDYAAARVAEAVAEERERCAHVCKGIAAGHAGAARRLQDLPATHAAGMRDGANECAAAIRGTEAHNGGAKPTAKAEGRSGSA